MSAAGRRCRRPSRRSCGRSPRSIALAQGRRCPTISNLTRRARTRMWRSARGARCSTANCLGPELGLGGRAGRDVRLSRGQAAGVRVLRDRGVRARPRRASSRDVVPCPLGRHRRIGCAAELAFDPRSGAARLRRGSISHRATCVAGRSPTGPKFGGGPEVSQPWMVARFSIDPGNSEHPPASSWRCSTAPGDAALLAEYGQILAGPRAFPRNRSGLRGRWRAYYRGDMPACLRLVAAVE